jgi:hypothetical protein
MSKKVKARFGLTMDPELLERIEEKRGLIPRATFIEYSMKKYFALQDVMKDEMKFYDEILGMLPDKVTQEDYDKLCKALGSIRLKVLKRKSSLSQK